MKMTIAAVFAAFVLSACTSTESRIGGAAAGAGAGALVGGPIGAIAGGAIGVMAGPTVTSSVR